MQSAAKASHEAQNGQSLAHWLPIVLALAPSLLIFLFPIYEEDPPCHVLGDPVPLWRWCISGRLLWYPVYETMRPILPGLPEASLVLAAFYTSILAAFLALLARFFSDLLGSRLRGSMAAALIATHFFFYEARVWNGHNMLTAAALILLGVYLGDRLLRGKGPWRVAGAACVMMGFSLLAFNAHQAGAMLMVPLVALRLARTILDGTLRRRAPWRRLLSMVFGYGCACILYTGQMVWAIRTIRPPNRLGQADPLEAVQAFGKLTLLWMASPIPALANRAPGALLVLSAILALLAFWAPRRVLPRRRLAAGAAVLTGALLSYTPALVAQGHASCRILTPALIAVWGGGCLFLVKGGATRLARPAWIVLTALLTIHVWGFGLLVAIKADARMWTERLHRELAAHDIQPGSTVRFHSVPFVTESLHWADLTRSLYDTLWGAEYMIRRDSFSSPDPLPEKLKSDFRHEAPLPPQALRPDPSSFVERLADGSALVWLPMISARSSQLEQRFLRPWETETTYPLPLLHKWGDVDVHGNAALWSKDSRTYLSLSPSARWRLHFRAIDLNRPWRMRIETKLHEGPGPCVVRLGMRLGDGTNRLLETHRIHDTDKQTRIHTGAEAEPNAMLWLEVESQAESGCIVRFRGDGLILEQPSGHGS